MEKTKMSYQNGKIYALRSYQTDNVYYGSTTQPLSKRMGFHKAHYKQWQSGKFNYMTSFEIVKFDDCYIELFENYPCNSKSELERREGEIIRADDNATNRIIVGRTIKEWREDNADKLKQQRKQYYIENADKLKQQHKQYYIDNADIRKQYSKQYFTDNADKIKLHQTVKHECPCGGKHTTANKSIHSKTKKHTKYLETIQA
jgi:hypothetical protein